MHWVEGQVTHSTRRNNVHVYMYVCIYVYVSVCVYMMCVYTV